MKNSKVRVNVYTLCISALLCAIGILIPLIMPFPLKFPIPPASFTLFSHLAIFLAIFISPLSAGLVAAGTALGFLLAGLDLVIVLRAASHIVFALIGAYYLQKHPNTLNRFGSSVIFGLCLAIIHSVFEVIVSTIFYVFNMLSPAVYDKGFLYFVILLVGVGTIVHSIVDFTFAVFIWKTVPKSLRSGR